jgi:hypothetical protein
MKTRTKAAVITVSVAVPAMALGPVFFPASSDWPVPEGRQLLLLGGFAAIEALALGLAVAFLVLGWPIVRRIVGPSRPPTLAAYLATAWLLGNWWLHDNLHLTNGANINGLIAIEYAFHATLIVAGGIVGWQLLRSADEGHPPVGNRPVAPGSLASDRTNT